jgi:hypothetical protein
MQRIATIAILLAALAGCASTADIDLTKVEPACGHSCSTDYSQCLGQFTIFPIQAQHQCTEALRLCVQTCPPR